MSLMIKGMDMPKNCRKCDFTHCTRFGQKLCTFLNEATSIKQKLPDCPVSEIPTPHGRLIDADRLMEVIERNAYTLINYCNSKDRGMFLCGIRQAIDEVPIIIEAEE